MNPLSAVSPIFFILALGFFLKHGNRLHHMDLANEFWDGADKLLYYILFPAAIIGNVSAVRLNENEIPRIIGLIFINISIMTIACIGLKKIIKWPVAQFTSILQCATRYNTYIFLSVAGSIFNSNTLMIAATVSAYMLILINVYSIFTIGFFMSQPEDDHTLELFGHSRSYKLWILIKSIIQNPAIIASVIGIIIREAEIELNSSLSKSMIFLGNASFCMAYLTIGADLRLNIRNTLKLILTANTLKLIACPLIMAIVLWGLGIRGVERDVCLVFSVIPASGGGSISKHFGGDYKLIGDITNTGIFACVLTMPIMLQILL